jgi:DNA-binding NtrC family response regulator
MFWEKPLRDLGKSPKRFFEGGGTGKFIKSLPPQENIDYICSAIKSLNMAKQGTILVVDDNKAILTAVQMLLSTHFEKTITISNPNTIKSILGDEKIDVVLLDMNFSAGINSGNEGLFWLNEIKKEYPALPVVLFTAYADIGLAVRGIKEGAADFVVKPWDNLKLIESLQTACEPRKAPGGKEHGKKKQLLSNESGMFWGESQAMQQLRNLIEKVAITDANMLITGENGTGKEMLAREIHLLSNRKNQAMISVDMGAITETLFESELFGHVKGSFTDARVDRPGKFEAADNSTLFLDEIGNLPYHLQAKLLTAIQQKSVVKVGSNTPIPVNIRLISATNRDLQQMVGQGQFREDLLYRINTIHVEIPPLRERQEDIVPLSEIFLEKYGNIYGKPALQLSADAKEKLKEQPWFGNIRELEHTIEKAVIISESNELEATGFHFPKKQKTALKEAATLEEMEYDMIRNAMDKYGGNLSMVANQLGISRQTLYNKIKRYEL